MKHIISTILALTIVVMVSADIQAAVIDLADIVGHGDGTGTGTKGYGYHPNTGNPTTGSTGTISGDDTYTGVSSSDYIDGVFVPDGGPGNVKITSTGTTVTLGNTDNRSWDYIKYGPNKQSESELGGIDYNSGTHTMIGLHANKGITFDLDGIEGASPVQETTRFTAVAGSTYSNKSTNIWVFVDGAQKFKQEEAVKDSAYTVDIEVAPSDRFLTLVATDRGNYSTDQVLFGDPRLEVTEIPEPTVLALLSLGGAMLMGRRRRRG